MQNAIDSLSRKLEGNTATISDLKSSVDLMHRTITQQKGAVCSGRVDSIKQRQHIIDQDINKS